MKHSVIYTKPVVGIHPKTKEKTIIEKGARAELDDDQLAAVRHAVRVIKPKKTEAKGSG